MYVLYFREEYSDEVNVFESVDKILDVIGEYLDEDEQRLDIKQKLEMHKRFAFRFGEIYDIGNIDIIKITGSEVSAYQIIIVNRKGRTKSICNKIRKYDSIDDARCDYNFQLMARNGLNEMIGKFSDEEFEIFEDNYIKDHWLANDVLGIIPQTPSERYDRFAVHCILYLSNYDNQIITVEDY